MKELFKELILEFHRSDLPHPSQREFTVPELPGGVKKALTFIGMRRSGKTWELYQIMHDLIASGIPLSKMLYLNFEDDRLVGMQITDFQHIVTAYFELYPDYLNDPQVHFFFDEIHEVDGWEVFIRRLLDSQQLQIYITGSSCKLLSKEIATSLRGRTLVQEVFPYSFREYLIRQSVTIPSEFSTSEKIIVNHHLHEYLKWGGFPETVGAQPEQHRNLIQGYINSVIYRDIIDRYKIRRSQALKYLLSHCLRNSATVFSINKIHQTLKSLRYNVSKNSLYDYMGYFEDAYCLFSLQKFDLSLRKAATSMTKIYAVDPGVITAFTVASEFDLAAQLETTVFGHLRRQSSKVFYYKTNEGKEVDFVVIANDLKTHLFQACVTLRDINTKRREVEALTQAMAELKLTKGTIITFDEEEDLITENGTVKIIPCWKFFLNRTIQ